MATANLERLPFLTWRTSLCYAGRSTLALIAATLTGPPAGADFGFSIECTDTVDVGTFLPIDVGTWWEYKETYRTSIGPNNENIELRWTRRNTIAGKYSIPEGELVEFKFRHSNIRYAPALDAESRKWLDTLPEQYDWHWLIRGNYVFCIPAAVWDNKTKAMDPGFANRFRDETQCDLCPMFFFPMDKVQRWSEPRREKDELERARLFAEGKGPAPNPGMWFWVVEATEEVSTPAGTFPKAYRLVNRSNTGPVFVWFQPGVGVVKQQTQHPGSLQESEAVLLKWKRGNISETTSR